MLLVSLLIFTFQVKLEHVDGVFGPMNRQWNPPLMSATDSGTLVILSGDKSYTIYHVEESTSIKRKFKTSIHALHVNRQSIFLADTNSIRVLNLSDLSTRKTIPKMARSFSSSENQVYFYKLDEDPSKYEHMIEQIQGTSFLKKPEHSFKRSHSFSISKREGIMFIAFENDNRVFAVTELSKEIERFSGSNVAGITPYFELPLEKEKERNIISKIPTVEEKLWLFYQEKYSKARTVDFISLDKGYLWVQEVPDMVDGYCIGTHLLLRFVDLSLQERRRHIRYGQYAGFKNGLIYVLYDSAILDGYDDIQIRSTDILKEIWNPYFSKRIFKPILEGFLP